MRASCLPTFHSEQKLRNFPVGGLFTELNNVSAIQWYHEVKKRKEEGHILMLVSFHFTGWHFANMRPVRGHTDTIHSPGENRAAAAVKERVFSVDSRIPRRNCCNVQPIWYCS